MGLLLAVIITTASVQDRDGARTVLDRLRFTMPSVAWVWADCGYAGKFVDWVRQMLRVKLQIARKPLGIRTFQVLPRRWVVERTFAWIDQVPPAGPRRRTPPRPFRSNNQMGDDGLMTTRQAPTPGRRPWQPSTVT